MLILALLLLELAGIFIMHKNVDYENIGNKNASIRYLMNYPEFVLAGLLLGIFMIFTLSREQEMHCPSNGLAEPATNCFAFAPASYIAWIQKTLVQAGWRNSHSFADFVSIKMYLPLWYHCCSHLFYLCPCK